MLKKILPPSNRSVTSVSKETGVAVVTINNWLAKLKEGKMSLDEDEENPSSMRKKDSKKIAAELFDATCRKENCHPDFVHLDNGEPMKGITLCAFYY